MCGIALVWPGVGLGVRPEALTMTRMASVMGMMIMMTIGIIMMMLVMSMRLLY